MIIRAVFFDLDGTLVNTIEDLSDAVNHVRSVFSSPPLTADAVQIMVGKGARNLIQQALPEASESDLDSGVGLFLDYNREHIADKSHLYPGILKTVHTLAASDIKMAVITNKNEDLCRLLLQTLGIHDLMHCISGGDTYPERKPSPLPLLKVAEHLIIPHHECVMVGDSINDIMAGQLAHITTVGCTWGYGSTEELAGADILVHTPRELHALIADGLLL